MAEICLKNISKSFGSKETKKQVLADISLDIKDKSFCVLLGPSGCGKSTLLRIIAGLEDVDSGEIFIGGAKMNGVLPKDRDIAFVFQSYALYPHLTGFDNMAFPLKIKKENKKTINEKVHEASMILGLDELLKRKPKELSGGQRQRVALGRAIVRNAKVFLLDEPLSNLDAKLRANMRFEIKKLHEKLGATFIYVTHDQTEALTMGDTVVILNEGKVFQKSTPEKLFKTPANTFVASFSGAYPMNLIEADISDGSIKINDFYIKLPEKYRCLNLNGKKVIMGLRPENIHFAQKEDEIRLSSSVDFVENTGAIKVVSLKTEIGLIKAVINHKESLPIETDFFFNPLDIILFDFETKNIICAQ